MNEEIKFKWTREINDTLPDNGFSEETDSIIVEPPFDFGDWLEIKSIAYENDGDIWYVLDESGERTGEAYMIISRNETDEELRG